VARCGPSLRPCSGTALAAAVALAGCGGAAVVADRPGVGDHAQDGPAPWRAETAHLAHRVTALGLPASHPARRRFEATLAVFVNGVRIPVPAHIGVDGSHRLLAPLHTDDGTGIIRVQAARPYPFTLGQFFATWGVAFSDSTIGGYTPYGKTRLWVYADGERIAHPTGYVLRPGDRIVVAYGGSGGFPTRLRPS
jgi:hypothetical protein